MQTSDFTDYLKGKGHSTSSIKSRLKHMDQYQQWLEKENLEAEQITYNDLLLYMKHYQKKGISQRTIQHYLGTIKHYYNHLIEQQQVESNPTTDLEIKGIKKKTLYHILDPQELHQLYEKYPETTLRDRRNKTMLGLLVYQGLTTTELSKLTVSDINLRSGQISVPGGKQSNSRDMQLEAYQVMAMYDYTLQVRPVLLEMKPKRKSQTQQETNQLFISEGGYSSHFSNLMTQLMVKVRKIHPGAYNAAQIRASVITKWLKQHNLREVQYLAGHRYVSSTESYLQNDLEGLQEEIQQYHPLG